jgi:plastocyanin
MVVSIVGCERSGDRFEPVTIASSVSIPVNADKRGPQGYRPNPLVVTPGTTVTWTNHDTIWHTVTSDHEGPSSSEPIPAGGTFSHTFTAPGTYPYHCAIPGHQMSGRVVVEP